MPAKISEILPDSIAEELDLQSGDEILSIDGTFPQDLIDLLKILLRINQL